MSHKILKNNARNRANHAKAKETAAKKVKVYTPEEWAAKKRAEVLAPANQTAKSKITILGVEVDSESDGSDGE